MKKLPDIIKTSKNTVGRAVRKLKPKPRLKLKTLVLIRGRSTNHGTFGKLYYQGQFVCYITELPDRNNRSNLSRINKGRYLVKYLPRSASGKYRDVYHVINVFKRLGILIHAGNVAGDSTLGLRTHSWGCLLPALRLGKLYGQNAGLASRGALQKIHSITQRKDFYLEIK